MMWQITEALFCQLWANSAGFREVISFEILDSIGWCRPIVVYRSQVKYPHALSPDIAAHGQLKHCKHRQSRNSM